MNGDGECGDQNTPWDEDCSEIHSGTVGDVLEGGKDPHQIVTADEMQYVDVHHNHGADWDGNCIAWVLVYHRNQRGDLISDVVVDELVDHPQSNLIHSVGDVTFDCDELDGSALGRAGVGL